MCRRCREEDQRNGKGRETAKVSTSQLRSIRVMEGVVGSMVTKGHQWSSMVIGRVLREGGTPMRTRRWNGQTLSRCTRVRLVGIMMAGRQVEILATWTAGRQMRMLATWMRMRRIGMALLTMWERMRWIGMVLLVIWMRMRRMGMPLGWGMPSFDRKSRRLPPAAGW